VPGLIPIQRILLPQAVPSSNAVHHHGVAVAGCKLFPDTVAIGASIHKGFHGRRRAIRQDGSVLAQHQPCNSAIRFARWTASVDQPLKAADRDCADLIGNFMKKF
jgi:hypothetical protein